MAYDAKAGFAQKEVGKTDVTVRRRKAFRLQGILVEAPP